MLWGGSQGPLGALNGRRPWISGHSPGTSSRRSPWRLDTAPGITPCDYGSVSEGLWPLFASRNCERQGKAQLVSKGVLSGSDIYGVMTVLAEERRVLCWRSSYKGRPFRVQQGVASSRTPAWQRVQKLIRRYSKEYSRPGSSYVVSREFPARPGSEMGRLTTASRRSKPIDILEEERNTSKWIEMDIEMDRNGMKWILSEDFRSPVRPRTS